MGVGKEIALTAGPIGMSVYREAGTGIGKGISWEPREQDEAW